MVDACDKDLGEFAREGEEKNVGDPSGSCSPKQTIKQEDQLRDTKAEISEVKEENERLKTVLSQIMKDYNSLHVNFFDIIHQEQAKKPIQASPVQHDVEENELVSLSLGMSSCGHKKEEKTTSEWIKRKEEDQIKDALSLGLDIKFEEPSSATSDPPLNLSPEVSFDEPKEEEALVETWPPSKVMKSLRDDEISQHVHAKRARVSVRARCETPTMNDGCQWRKYGQKIAKGNPCPRAYYRCTVAAGCPVRKQVQRCAEDMSILITTYEGIHNHPLPISATTMASTTSAAASMLTSGSTSSSVLRDLNFALPNNYSKSNHFYLQNHTLSSSNPLHPTITLDLTTQPPSSSSTSQLNKFSPNFISNTRYSPSTSRSLCFNSLEPNAMPTTWSSGYLSYGAQQSYNNNDKVQIQTTSAASSSSQHHPLTDTIAKVITSDPSFQTMLAAAITSYVGAGREGERSAAAGGNGSGCGSSYMTGSDSLNSGGYQGNMALLRQSMGFSGANGATSPVENREHNV